MVQTTTTSVLQLVILLYISIPNKFLVHGHECRDVAIYGWFGVDCADSTNTVPQDLNPDIEILYFYNVNLTGLKGDVFGKYKILKMLFMENVTIDDPIDPAVLSPLKSLKSFSFKNIAYINKEFKITLPTTLGLINFSFNSYITQLDLKTLSQLSRLYCRNCSLTELPLLNRNAPLKIMDLSYNPLKRFLAEEIAPFCLLNELTILWSENSLVPTKEHYCECRRLGKWMDLLNILNPAGVPLNCTGKVDPSTNHTEKCNMGFSQDVINMYGECYAKHSPPPPPPPVFNWIFVIVPATIIGVIVFMYGTYRICLK